MVCLEEITTTWYELCVDPINSGKTNGASMKTKQKLWEQLKLLKHEVTLAYYHCMLEQSRAAPEWNPLREGLLFPNISVGCPSCWCMSIHTHTHTYRCILLKIFLEVNSTFFFNSGSLERANAVSSDGESANRVLWSIFSNCRAYEEGKKRGGLYI